MTFLWINNSQQGPFGDGAIMAMLGDGTASGETLAWKEGLPDWVPLKTIQPLLHAKPKLRFRVPSVSPGIRPQLANNRGTSDDALLRALEPPRDSVSEVDLFSTAGFVPGNLSRLESPTGNPPKTLYRWPQFPMDIGLIPGDPDYVSPVRTKANGTPIPPSELREIVTRITRGDRKALFEMVYILSENSNIESDRALARAMSDKADELVEASYRPPFAKTPNGNATYE